MLLSLHGLIKTVSRKSIKEKSVLGISLPVSNVALLGLQGCVGREVVGAAATAAAATAGGRKLEPLLQDSVINQRDKFKAFSKSIKLTNST